MQALSLPAIGLPVLPQDHAGELYGASRDAIHCRTDRLFAKLMFAQWLGGIAAALWISPRTWAGGTSQIHVHVWAAIILGGVISSFPIFLALKQPGATLTRHCIAVGQMLTSALLIHLTGGRIETHFHVFGSLAFLAFYRDWKVLATATVVVAADHLMRGLFWPESVFGVLTASPWRWLEHAGWVLFEDLFLMISIQQGLREMKEVATRRARIESAHAETERIVQERTAELTTAHHQLLEASHEAGRAEVATYVLHNVGNVLNSVNVSAEMVATKVRGLRIVELKKAAGLLRENAADLPSFLTQDPRGQKLPGYLTHLAENLAEPQRALLEEVESLRKNIEHIKEVVATQQTYARRSGVLETFSPIELVEDAIRINSAGFIRHEVNVHREYDDVPPIITDRHKALQIIVNLLGNAKYALSDKGPDRQLVVRVAPSGDNGVTIAVIDNGEGIPPENLIRIFQHGFTTKKDGHGFGLHSSALAAKELGGKLTAHSDGVGRGAVFTLELPLQNN
jgi:signal transduction histidine kinase